MLSPLRTPAVPFENLKFKGTFVYQISPELKSDTYIAFVCELDDLVEQTEKEEERPIPTTYLLGKDHETKGWAASVPDHANPLFSALAKKYGIPFFLKPQQFSKNQSKTLRTFVKDCINSQNTPSVSKAKH